MKTSLTLAGVALVAATMAGCGSDADSAYCQDLESASKEFKSLNSSDLGQLDKAFQTFHELADQAPSEIEDDWKVLDDGITSVEQAFEEAGIEPADLTEIQQGNLPEGVEVEKLEGLATEFSKLSSAEFEEASTAIEKHAKDTCEVDLNAA